VIIEVPEGSTYDPGETVRAVFIVRDPDGVSGFTWGIFTQNLTPLIGGDKDCGGATECSLEVKEDAPGVPGTYILGADAQDTTGKVKREVGEIYVE
jgi:hypothetical protein